jgi:Ras of Complex, Roc, domain of DAPkinase
LHFLFIFEARQKTGLPIRKTIGRKAELLREGFGLAWEAIQQPIADYVKSQIICDFTLGPLAGLKSLQILNLSGCEQLSEFAPLELLLPIFQRLYLFGCNLKDVPSEVCAESRHENVLAEVHAHYEDLKAGRRRDAEIKVLFLGNGGTGKTQLCRRLRGEPFDASVPTTQGMQLSEKTMELEDFPEPVRLNLWDFGGQEIYLPVGLALNAQLGSSRNRGSDFCSPSLAERKCSSPTSIPNRRGFTLQSLGKSGLSASVPLSSQL